LFLNADAVVKLALIGEESPERSEDLERKAGSPFLNTRYVSLQKNETIFARLIMRRPF